MFRSPEDALPFLEEMTPGAFDVYGGGSGVWSWRPESVADEPVWYDWCDDCQTFHKSWYVFGYEVHPGKVMGLVWCVDQDGRWDVADEEEVGTPEHAALLFTYGARSWEKSYSEYMQYIAKTGRDPCKEFLPPPVVRIHESWRVHVFERGGYVWLMRCELLSRDEKFEFLTREVTQSFRPGDENFPSYMETYLRLERLADIGGYALDPSHSRSVKDLAASWHPGEHRGQYVAEMEVSHEISAIDPDEWAEELRRRACRAIASLYETTSRDAT